MQIAYGFEKPVLVTNVGGLPDVVTDGRTGYVVEPKSAEAIAAAIIDFYKQDREVGFVEEVKKAADKFSWTRMENVISSMIEEQP